MKKATVAFILATLISGCKTNPPISGLNDRLEKDITISSESFSKPLMLIYQSADPFFRGYIEKSTKKQSHQLYIRVNSGNEFENWSKLVFLKDGELTEIITKRVSYNVEGKAFYEDIVANLSTSDIEWISKQKELDMRIKSGRSDIKIDFSIKGEEAISYLKNTNSAISSLN